MAEWGRYRELVHGLAVKDLKVQYKSAALGFLWALLNPLALTLILTFVFSAILRVPIEQYPLFLLTGLFPWMFLSHSLSSSTSSIVDHAALIKKVPFPTEVIPISIVMSKLVNFLLQLLILLVLLLIFRQSVTWSLVTLPVLVLVHVLFATGVSLMAAALNVHYRDVKFIVDSSLVAWFYATPIVYSLAMVPDALRGWYLINPMAGFISWYRAILLEGHLPDPGVVMSTVVMAIGMLVAGVFVFRQHKPNFADLV